MPHPGVLQTEVQPSDGWARLLGGFVTVFAVWTAYCHALVYAAADFHLLLSFSWLPLAVSVVLIRYLPRLRLLSLGPSWSPGYTRPSRVPREIWIAGAILIVLLYASGASYYAFWLLAVSYLVGMIIFGAPADEKQHRISPGLSEGWSNAIVGILIISAIVITMVSHRPNFDDAFYLNVAVSAIDHPARPLLRFDGMYGEQGLPLLAYFYRINSYELLVAVVSSVTQLSTPAIYYIFAPAIMAAFVVIAYWLALRELGGRWAIPGLVVAMLVLVAWGDVGRSYGNFSFVRLFQGKGPLISICIPAVIYFAVRYVCHRDAYSWVGLTLTQIAAIGFSTSALVVVPVAAALVLIGAWRPNRSDTWMLVVGLMSSVYLVGTAILLIQGMESASSMGAVSETFSTEAGLKTVLGDGGRAYIALFALLAAPALATSPAHHRILAGTVLATVILILNPLTAGLVGKVIANMSWRIFWSVPFPLWIGVACAGIVAYGASRRSWQSGIAGATALAAIFALVPGVWTVSAENNHARLGVPGYKVSPEYDAAKVVIEVTPRDGLVLAPWKISAWIPTFEHHPPVLAVRKNYLFMIAMAHGEKEARIRDRMVRFVSGVKHYKESQRMKILTNIEDRGFATVVLPTSHPFGPQVGQRLRAMGYNSRAAGNYDIWVLHEDSLD